MNTGSTMKLTLSSGLSRSTIIKISVFFSLNMLDYGLTWYGLSNGIALEINPLFSSMPYVWMGLVKTAQSLIIIYMVGAKFFHTWALNIAIAFMSIVCLWNIFVIGGF
ncbi:hypothetical protein LCGC14_1096330 [marine sediment metagenome]|uniref:DUF5658 domain-containing protein n=1 Tax=marine sediment metagenome TaxID=412755 RepID=A0A0F9MYL5_9ZZZZ